MNINMQKDIGKYIVYSEGKVWSKHSKRFIKTSLHTKGYVIISIFSKPYLLHRIIAETFLSNPLNLPQINHKNGIKTDNRVENLEWCNQSHNIRHALDTGLNQYKKLTEEQVRKIKYEHNNLSHTQIAKIYNISRPSITLIRNNKSWKHV